MPSRDSSWLLLCKMPTSLPPRCSCLIFFLMIGNVDLYSTGGGEHCGRVPGRREGHHRDLLCEGRHHRHRLPAGEGEAQCSAHQGQVVLLVMQILLLIRNFLRFCLVVVGDMSTLERASQDLWGELIKDARSRGRYLSFILCHSELSCKRVNF